MTTTVIETPVSGKIGDRLSSDVVVRLRTQDGRDDWIYCHSDLLTKNSKYFADRLSDNWPTCQILDSRYCVEVHCQESNVDYHIIILRLFYDGAVGSLTHFHSVKNALGLLQVANELICPHIIASCVDYLEAVPWDEFEEEEILRIIPNMGLEVKPILARLQPVNVSATVRVFLSTIQFATSLLPSTLNDLKSSAQDQIEYMLTEDDDSPMIVADDSVKSKVGWCVQILFSRFSNLLVSLQFESKDSNLEAQMLLLHSQLKDLSWACQILTKLELMKTLANKWVDASENIVKVVDRSEMVDIKLKVTEVTSKVLDSMAYGTVILPTFKRLQMVKIWLPFVRVTKPLIDSDANIEDHELWQSLESAFVSIVLALPSSDQADILNEWLKSEHVHYPDLSEAFEVWCYRTKVASRRLAVIGDDKCIINNSSTMRL
ncbi:BTB/POZ domain-containing protein At3g05675 [Impatiens glandulifera]|uniref:BTB/POZ domain-containing protein At3g05675 n=1 Tax=Impatiens glandulifera TaxID=253017 RepID=UPI001FB0E6F9|nr:BTB/POZ domain-containing protein At3g05675 [Impatiens glandulifera]XP_047310389.1 BTB/POZ domain-containing protein At3g05675 [Impatiens glandulifera]